MKTKQMTMVVALGVMPCLLMAAENTTNAVADFRSTWTKKEKSTNQAPVDTYRKLAQPEDTLTVHLNGQAEHPEAMKKFDARRRWMEEHPEAMKEMNEFNRRYAVLVKTQAGRIEAVEWFKAHRRIWEGSPFEAETLQEIKQLESDGK